MQKQNQKKILRPPQKQNRPGLEVKMKPFPIFDDPYKKGSDKLKDKIAFITGGDSGIGKATAILFAKEGADIAIAYLSETADAKETKQIIEKKYKQHCLLIKGDLSKERHCKVAVKRAVKEFGRIDILVTMRVFIMKVKVWKRSALKI